MRIRRRSSGMLHLGDAQRERGAALARPRHFDRAAGRRGDALDDGEPQAAAARPLGAAAAVERLEEMLYVARGAGGAVGPDGGGHTPPHPPAPPWRMALATRFCTARVRASASPPTAGTSPAICVSIFTFASSASHPHCATASST